MKIPRNIILVLILLVLSGCVVIRKNETQVKVNCEWDENCKIVSEHTHSMPKKK